MTPERQKNLDELISALCDEAASPEQIGQLEELLRSDPECRTFYLRYVDLHARLMQHPGFRPLVLADARPVRDPRTPDGSPPASPFLVSLAIWAGEVGASPPATPRFSRSWLRCCS